MDILSSQASVADLQGLFTSPTPLTSTLRGLLTLIAAAAVYAAFHPLRDQKPNKEFRRKRLGQVHRLAAQG